MFRARRVKLQYGSTLKRLQRHGHAPLQLAQSWRLSALLMLGCEYLTEWPRAAGTHAGVCRALPNIILKTVATAVGSKTAVAQPYCAAGLAVSGVTAGVSAAFAGSTAFGASAAGAAAAAGFSGSAVFAAAAAGFEAVVFIVAVFAGLASEGLASEDLVSAGFAAFESPAAVVSPFGNGAPSQHAVASAVQVCSSKTMKLRNSSHVTVFVPVVNLVTPRSANFLVMCLSSSSLASFVGPSLP